MLEYIHKYMYACIYVGVCVYLQISLCICVCVCVFVYSKSLQLYLTLATLWTVACQASLFMGFSMQEYWMGCMPSSRGSS